MILESTMKKKPGHFDISVDYSSSIDFSFLARHVAIEGGVMM